MKRKNVESSTQISCVKWFRMQFPEYGNLLFSIPNGGKRNVITAMILKAEGALAGVPDLFLSLPKLDSNMVWTHGLYIEMKTCKGTQSKEQKDFMLRVRVHGYQYEVVRSVDDFIKVIKDYLTNN
jgi:hypothetical protein